MAAAAAWKASSGNPDIPSNPELNGNESTAIRQFASSSNGLKVVFAAKPMTACKLAGNWGISFAPCGSLLWPPPLWLSISKVRGIPPGCRSHVEVLMMPDSICSGSGAIVECSFELLYECDR